MKIFLLLTIVVATRTVSQQCSNYCKNLSSNQFPLKWQLQCDCSKPVQTHARQPTSSVGTILKIDENGIYYEPAEFYPVERPSYFDQPFYIVNPFFKGMPASLQGLSHVNTNYNNNGELARSANYKTNNRRKDKLTDNLPSKQLYSYLDVAVDDESTQSRSIIDEINNENLNKIEHSLSECMDLLIFLSSKHYNTITELRHLWESNKFDKYNKLSYGNLVKEIDNYCNDSNEFIKRNLNDIVANWPKKKYDIKTNNLSEKELNNNMFSNNTDFRVINNNTNRIDFNEYHDIKSKERKENSMDNHVKIGSMQFQDIEEYFHRKNNEDISRGHNIVQQHNPNNFIEHATITPNLNLLTTSIEELDENYEYENHDKLKVQTSSDVGMDSEYFDKFNTSNDDLMTTSNDHTIEIVTKPYFKQKIIENVIEKQNEIKFIKRNSNMKTILENKQNDKKIGEPVTIVYAESRNIYSEHEIPIQKIITREMSNDTVVSVINGTETLPNTDFNHNFIYEEILNNKSQLLNEDIEINNISKKMENKLENAIPTLIYPEISGNLFFLFDQEHIPAKFVQNVDGNIHLGIDGISLCKNMNRGHENKSMLLITLCNCAQFHNCSKPVNLN